MVNRKLSPKPRFNINPRIKTDPSTNKNINTGDTYTDDYIKKINSLLKLLINAEIEKEIIMKNKNEHPTVNEFNSNVDDMIARINKLQQSMHLNESYGTGIQEENTNTEKNNIVFSSRYYSKKIHNIVLMNITYADSSVQQAYVIMDTPTKIINLIIKKEKNFFIVFLNNKKFEPLTLDIKDIKDIEIIDFDKIDMLNVNLKSTHDDFLIHKYLSNDLFHPDDCATTHTSDSNSPMLHNTSKPHYVTKENEDTCANSVNDKIDMDDLNFKYLNNRFDKNIKNSVYGTSCDENQFKKHHVSLDTTAHKTDKNDEEKSVTTVYKKEFKKPLKNIIGLEYIKTVNLYIPSKKYSIEIVFSINPNIKTLYVETKSTINSVSDLTIKMDDSDVTKKCLKSFKLIRN